MSSPAAGPVATPRVDGPRTIVPVLTALAALVAAQLGVLYNFLVVLLLPGTIALGAARLVRARRVERRPRLVAGWTDTIAVGVRTVFWLLVGLHVWRALPFGQLGGSYRMLVLCTWLAVAVRVALAIAPRRRHAVAATIVFGVGVAFLTWETLSSFVLPPSGAVTIADPLPGRWYVIQGGRSVIHNHHFVVRSQRHALDVTQTANGRTYRGDASRLAAHLAYGRPVVAPVTGEVVTVVDGLDDNPIGRSDVAHRAGNHLVIDMGHGRFVLLAHLEKGSIRVALAEWVSVGDTVAAVGNSGNTSEPHLHVEVIDRPDIDRPGARSYPMLFTHTELRRLGRTTRPARVDPFQNDEITRLG